MHQIPGSSRPVCDAITRNARSGGRRRVGHSVADRDATARAYVALRRTRRRTVAGCLRPRGDWAAADMAASRPTVPEASPMVWTSTPAIIGAGSPAPASDSDDRVGLDGLADRHPCGRAGRRPGGSGPAARAPARAPDRRAPTRRHGPGPRRGRRWTPRPCCCRGTLTRRSPSLGRARSGDHTAPVAHTSDIGKCIDAASAALLRWISTPASVAAADQPVAQARQVGVDLLGQRQHAAERVGCAPTARRGGRARPGAARTRGRRGRRPPPRRTSPRSAVGTTSASWPASGFTAAAHRLVQEDRPDAAVLVGAGPHAVAAARGQLVRAGPGRR